MIFINPHKCCTFVTEKSCLTSNANLCIIQKLKLLPSHYLYWGETLVNRSFLAIRHILAEFFGKITQKTTFLKLFSCYEKRLHSPFLPLHRQNKEVWVSGLNQYTANVPNRKVPKVRNRLKREQKPSLLGLCRVHGDSQRNPSGVYMEFVAQLVECQVVALVVMGSIPIKLPNASIAQW